MTPAALDSPVATPAFIWWERRPEDCGRLCGTAAPRHRGSGDFGWDKSRVTRVVVEAPGRGFGRRPIEMLLKLDSAPADLIEDTLLRSLPLVETGELILVSHLHAELATDRIEHLLRDSEGRASPAFRVVAEWWNRADG